MIYKDSEITSFVNELIINEIEDSGHNKSKFTTKCIHSMIEDKYRLNLALQREVEILEDYVDLCNDELFKLEEREDILKKREEELFVRYYELKNEKEKSSLLDTSTKEAIESVKGIIERTNGNIDMRMINFNARKCHRSPADFMNLLEENGVQI